MFQFHFLCILRLFVYPVKSLLNLFNLGGLINFTIVKILFNRNRHGKKTESLHCIERVSSAYTLGWNLNLYL